MMMLLGMISSRISSGAFMPPPPVAEGDGDALLGVVLPDDVLVEFRDDLARGAFFVHGDVGGARPQGRAR